ncbi:MULTISPECIES: quinohemoprotein amine dehydrogenase subunit beta [Pseudomonas]|uniref:Quinohemoprotein amine dehydrogenase subunit beta n=1 Tax=Pseudomonas chlororaphis TaxID=587753 RepID=A0AAQ0AMW7_9PSED|nr:MULTISPECIES: quinohemoprotein amine dehydrogenase subunit beta [Pseudomonas]AUG42160.1 quinohemoprotein amine dehydrogenase subunit beta [Pseudomonas chlororaphis]POA64776.1 quinohemoprotein amine dehydrogenase subunit beta [Pseudomonas sp. GW531-T4]QNR46015.1 quinohemoprotein amine dehydrogenase subunit beta [Pseudomonas chlororaphis]WJV25050.1 quinohemoprotein amine dehydrogenase subunit beta [Pseudomonas chlororaphis]
MLRKNACGLAASVILGACSLGVLADDNTDNKALNAGHEYMVTTNYPNNLHVIDLASDTLYKTCKMPDAFGPGTVQLAPDRKVAYVLNNHYADVYGVELDSCKQVFHASITQQPGEKARSMFAFTVSHDGKELYTVANPTQMLNDRYEVKQPRLDVYATDAGLKAKPVRSFPAPRQLTIMQSGDDGSLYVAGADVYKVDVKTGKFDVLIPSRHWKRPNYSAPDVLYVWNQQTWRHDFSLLYTAAKFKDKKQDPASAEYLYGLFSIDLKTGKSETTDFGPLTEIYFSGMRSPKDPNLMFGVLNRLAKYDIKQKKLLQAATLDHSYYCISFNKAGSKIYLAGTFNDVAIFDADSLKQIGSIKLPGGDMAITTAQVFER